MLKNLFKIDKSTNCKSLEKIIFLDIDGVMNHEHSTEDMDGACLYQLKRIIDCTGAKIVLTSSWKMYYLRGDENPVKLYFEKRLHSFGLELFDIAPHIGSGKRALEIKQWLAEHKNYKSYVIIDDNMFPGFQKMKEHLCLTNWSNGGLTKECADMAINILNQS
ncbi:MAG: hypothetical protein E7253_05635 [Lachnospiraceae bacterium]|nr:hypothetical protein [Lachnospiraceae bacterium]